MSLYFKIFAQLDCALVTENHFQQLLSPCVRFLGQPETTEIMAMALPVFMV